MLYSEAFFFNVIGTTNNLFLTLQNANKVCSFNFFYYSLIFMKDTINVEFILRGIMIKSEGQKLYEQIVDTLQIVKLILFCIKNLF